MKTVKRIQKKTVDPAFGPPGIAEEIGLHTAISILSRALRQQTPLTLQQIKTILAILENLLQSRHKLPPAFSTPSLAADCPVNRFLWSFLQLLEKHLAEPDLSIDRLCRVMGVSHSQLNRRLHRLTHYSAAHLLCALRLQRAAALLRQTELHVAEIAYTVGFNDPHYFTRLFTRYFRVCPTKYRQSREFQEDVNVLSTF